MGNKKASILIVDDNANTRALLRGILRSEESIEYIVAGEASDGESGLEQALRLRPDIVFLDVVMPKSDGLQVLKQIKEQLPKTVVLMVTSSHDPKTVKDAVDGGASGYIVKPFNTGTILNMMQQAVDKSHTLKAAAKAADGAESES